MHDTFNISGVRWCGFHFERLSFYCTPETADKIQLLCDNEELKITINN